MDVARVAWIGLDFLPQLVDEHAQIFGLFAVVRPPDGLQQPPMRQRLSLIGHQMSQAIQIPSASAGRPLPLPITERLSKSIFKSFEMNGGNDSADAARRKRRSDARHQFLGAEWLHNIVVRAGIERLHFVAFRVAHGQHDDGHVARSGEFRGRSPGRRTPGMLTSSRIRSGRSLRICSSASSPVRASATV